MKVLEKIALKYLIIGISVGLLKILLIVSTGYIFEVIKPNNYKEFISLIIDFSVYSSNIIVGLFILIDSFKLKINNYVIGILGFFMPIIGVCFLLIENYLILKNKNIYE